MQIQLERLDHLVLTVHDISASIHFYTRILGMKAVTFGNARTALVFGDQKINLHQLGNEFEPKAEKVASGSADLCFVTKQNISQILEHLKTEGIDIIEGPVIRTGARSPLLSIYFRDPDGNLLEVANEVDL